LRYKSFQVQNNFQEFAKNHALTFGVSAERYESENVFNSASQSIYTYNSLQDFYTDANAFLNQTGPTGVRVRRFDLRWNNIPGQEKPIQPLKVFYAGGASGRLAPKPDAEYRTRWDAPFFSQTGYQNVNADALTFQDENNNPVSTNGRAAHANAVTSASTGTSTAIAPRSCAADPASSPGGRPMCGSPTRSAIPAC
jgi:pectate lyase